MKMQSDIGARDSIVQKSNSLIQKSRFSLSLQQQRLILYIISKIQPWDDDFKLYSFTIPEFCRICGISPSGNQYAELKEAISALGDKRVWIQLDDERETWVRWLERAYFSEKNGIVEVKLDSLMKPFLLQLKENFTRFELWNTLLFRSRYSTRLYELVKSLHYHELDKYEKSYTVEELQALMGAEVYASTYDFMRRALLPALEEINKYTDKMITCLEIRKGQRKIIGFRLIIETKEPVEILKCRHMVEQELGGEQLSLWDKVAQDSTRNDSDGERYTYTLVRH